MAINLPREKTDGDTFVEYAVAFTRTDGTKMQGIWSRGWTKRAHAKNSMKHWMHSSYYTDVRVVQRTVEYRTSEWVDSPEKGKA